MNVIFGRLLEFPAREQMYLETNSPMRPGRTFSVRLKFEYNLTHSLEGFYLSSYKVLCPSLRTGYCSITPV